MILIKNNQKNIKLNTKEIKKYTQKTLNILNYSDFDLNIVFTTNKKIQKFNKEFRKIDKPTDILSFPYHTLLNPPKKIIPKNEDDKILGDLIISLEYIQEKINEYNQSFDDRLKVLIVHGICHLLGYDHETDKDYKIMHKLEKDILNKL